MKLNANYKVREMAGEHIIVMPGRYGADMTRVIALNATSLFLWNQLQGKDFEADEVAQLLVGEYDIDLQTATRDAEGWIRQLCESGIVER